MATLSTPSNPRRYSVLILARSYKLGAWCVAGKIIGTRQHGKWVRLVGRDTTEGISSDRLRLANSTGLASPLDLLDLSLASCRPYLYQRENVELGPDALHRISHLDAEDAIELADSPQNLWRSRQVSEANRLPLSDALHEQNSLTLIRCSNVRIYSVAPAQRKFRARFVHQNETYDLPVTDPDVQRLAAGMPRGRLIPDALLTLSLGLPFHNYCYKLVASLIPVNA
ncbi:hypothetical protein [Dechloromonas sp.]|uniref:dual OB domain-containing protein n=1 Tax=Dechloromonas sp. TaxID=1917218 RepID=UPI00216D4752|nr:hypothetical protein [Dechloromonas sp.]MBU3696541.1 hypothetical protein [Dechloromonas sp.]